MYDVHVPMCTMCVLVISTMYILVGASLQSSTRASSTLHPCASYIAVHSSSTKYIVLVRCIAVVELIYIHVCTRSRPGGSDGSTELPKSRIHGFLSMI